MASKPKKPDQATIQPGCGSYLGESNRVGSESISWVPPMDFFEVDDKYVLNAELPGVDSSDIKIEVSGLDLTIRGERKFDVVCSKENYVRLEGHRGRFHRTFSVSEPVDSGQIQMNLRDGVLHLVIPKSRSGQKPRAAHNSR